MPPEPPADQPDQTARTQQVDAQGSQGYINQAGTVNQNFGEQHNANVPGGIYIEARDSTLNIIPPTPAAALHQLRAPIPNFVGRADDVARLVQTLSRAAAGSGAAAAISGIRGLGGIGKTELAYFVAYQVAGMFPDAQLLIELRGASDPPLSPAQALQMVIRAFAPDLALPDDLEGLQKLYRSLLNGKRALILADDARDATQVRPLLPPQGCALLVTSRQRFNLPGMTPLDLGTLAPAEAEALLLSICGRIGAAAARLAQLCGYLPLALHVSAGLFASDQTLPVADYLQALEDERTRLAGLRDPDDPALDYERRTLFLIWERWWMLPSSV
jgi:hypothetical protein